MRCVVSCGGTSFFSSIMWWHLISMACILLCTSAVGVLDSQAYREMDVTGERISSILELRKILQSFKTGFNLVNAAVEYSPYASSKPRHKALEWSQVTHVERIGPVLFRAVCGAVAANYSADNSRRGLLTKWPITRNPPIQKW